MQSDFNGNGSLGDDNDLIGYSYANQTISTRRNQSDSLIPLLSHVTDFSLTYFSVLTGEDVTDSADNIGLTKNAADFEPLIQKIELDVSIQVPDLNSPTKTKTLTARRTIFPKNLMY